MRNESLLRYEKTLSRQQATLNVLRELLDELGRFGICPLPLKGADFLLRSASSRGVRSMSDVDLLIPKKDLTAAALVLESKGFSPRYLGRRFLTASFTEESLDFVSKDRRAILDVIWSTPYWDERDVLPLWDRSLLYSTPIGQRRLLHPEDALLYQVAYAVAHRRCLSPSFTQDLGWLLQEADKIDWARWGDRVRSWGLSAVVWHGLSYARQQGAAAIPPDLLEKLRPRSLSEKATVGFLRRMAAQRTTGRLSYLFPFLEAPRWKGKRRLLRRAFFPEESFIRLRCGKKSLGERLLVGGVRPFRILFRGLKILPGDFTRLLRSVPHDAGS